VPAEEDLLQFAGAKNPCQFREAEEGDEQHTYENGQGNNFLPGSPTEVGNAGAEGLPAIHAEGGFFEDFETTSTTVRAADFRRVRRHVTCSQALDSLLKSYLDYYHRSLTLLALGKDAPEPRMVQPPELGSVVELPEVGGLDNRYERRAA
jgi:hypothetical protein